MCKIIPSLLVGTVLAAAVSLGADFGWRLRESAGDRGCVPLPAAVSDLDLELATPGTVRFAALGDSGTGSPGAHQVADALHRVCATRGCDFVLLLGDNFYPDGVSGPDDPRFDSELESVYGGLGIPLVPVLGNHDVHHPAIHEPYHSRDSELWHMPNYEYEFRAGPARFQAINTNCSAITWWRLLRREPSSFSGWTIIVGHHSLYSDGQHGDAPAWQRLLWKSMPTRVDYYLSGHNHLLEHLDRPGSQVQYVVSGTAGGETSTAIQQEAGSAARSLFRSSAPGFAWFELSAIEAHWRFYDATGKVLYETSRRHPSATPPTRQARRTHETKSRS